MDKAQVRVEKIKVLEMIWDNLVRELHQKINKTPNKQMGEFMASMDSIKPEVRDAALKQYMIQCDMKHAIAFYQWRYMYPPSTVSSSTTRTTAHQE